MANLSAVGSVREEIASQLNEVESDNTDQYNTWLTQCARDIHGSTAGLPIWQTSADRTLSSGTRLYTNLPTDFDKMNSITYPAGDIKLSFLSPEEFDVFQPSATEGGNPTIYTIRGYGADAGIEYYPVPGSSLTVHLDYQKGPPTFSAGSGQTISAVPAKYTDLLVMYGVRQGLRRKGMFAESREVNLEYETLKQKMVTDLMEQTTEPRRFRSGREFTGSAYDDPVKNAIWGNN